MRDAAIDTFRDTGRDASGRRTSGAPELGGATRGGSGEGAPRRAARSVGKPGLMGSAAIAAQRLGGRRGPGAQPRSAPPGVASRLLGRAVRVKPFKAITVAVFSVSLVGIVCNAMVFQSGRHPAPLLGGGPVAAIPEAPAAAASVPAAPSSSDRTGTIGAAPAEPASMPAVGAAPSPAKPKVRAPKPPHAARPHAEPAGTRAAKPADPAAADAVSKAAGKTPMHHARSAKPAEAPAPAPVARDPHRKREAAQATPAAPAPAR